MATVTFRGKVKTVYNMDDSIAYQYIKIPALNHNHCDMNAFRVHRKYGSYANSSIFCGILGRIKNEVFGQSSLLRLDAIPEKVVVDSSKFLAVVTFEV